MCANNKTTTIYISLFSFLFLTFTSFIIAFFSFSPTCFLYLRHISLYLTSLLKPEAVQLQVHAVNHRHSRGKQAEPGKLATPTTMSHGVTPANRMDVTRGLKQLARLKVCTPNIVTVLYLTANYRVNTHICIQRCNYNVTE